ncbi:MAG: hypothetical protein R2873_26530 [Caldilineaceae bacterium]
MSPWRHLSTWKTEFVGVISVDVSLTRLIDRLNRLTPTPGSCAFAHRRRRAGWWRPACTALDDLLNAETVRLMAKLNAGVNETQHVIETTMGLPLEQVTNQSFQQTLADYAQQRQRTGALHAQKQRDLSGLARRCPT